jgi:hypothetical protein
MSHPLVMFAVATASMDDRRREARRIETANRPAQRKRWPRFRHTEPGQAPRSGDGLSLDVVRVPHLA